MGNYYEDTPILLLEQLRKWMQGCIYKVIAIDSIFCYIIVFEDKYYYREIDFAERRLFSALIRIPSTAVEKDELAYDMERMPPTGYMAQALKSMGVI